MRVNFGERQFLYSEGSAHREAANIVEESESAETVMANFGALPFAVGSSDSEGEGEESGEGGGASVVELAHTGLPTRKLKPPIATVGKRDTVYYSCTVLLVLIKSYMYL